MSTQIALQLYTLRNFTKTPDDIARTLNRVKKIGYDAVQVSALGKIEPEKLADILKNEGLVCCATHVGLDRLRDQTENVIAEHKLWGCEYTALGHANFRTAEGWDTFINDFNAIAAKFRGTGVHLGYHNHSNELVKYDGQSPLRRMQEKFLPEVWFEVDVYWITHGGGDPAAEIDRWAGRLPCIHLKDMSVELNAEQNHEQRMAVVGEGNLNFPRIIESTKKAGTKWFIVEQDNCYGQDPFDCAARSLKNVKAMGLV
ncbi:MAG: sugar phosphate isomerase/epimerase [Tepidisphaeraceae bacterium]